MWIYLLLFIIPVVWYLSGLAGDDSRVLAVFMAGLALFVGLSDMLGGYDRYIYGEIFDSFANVTTWGGSYAASGVFRMISPVEVGWGGLNIVLSWFTANRYIFILAVTLITYTCLFVSLRRYAVNYPFALILFLGLWFFFTFTYLRQVLAASVAWLAIPYIIKRKFWKFLPLALITMSLHKSGIIFFPMYFFATHRYQKRTLFIVVIVTVLIGLTPLPNYLFQTYGDVTNVVHSDYSSMGSMRVEYLLEAVFFLFFLFRLYDTFDQDRTTVVMVNLAFMFCLTLVFFIRSDNGGRLAWYYIIGIICLFSAIGSPENKVSFRAFGPLLVIVSFALFFRIVVAWGALVNPYKSFLTNGVRSNDRICKQYEYDTRYSQDKMYRIPFRLKVNIRQ